jgi:SAM-dependent methyltransferase
MGYQLICEVCLNQLNGPVLDLGFFPLCDDLVAIGQDFRVPVYHQEIQLCVVCYTAHQLHPVEKSELFKPNYHYRSALTDDVLNGMRDLVNEVSTKFPIYTDTKVLDVGCNDGSLLKIFKDQTGCRTFGIDPTDAIQDAGDWVDHKVQNFFDSNSAERLRNSHGAFDVITFTNVFAHIEDLPALIEALKIVAHDKTVFVIENHYLGSIVKNNQFDTFYHEHPRTYSYQSFKFIAKAFGLNIISAKLTKRYGGNIRVIIGQTENSDNNPNSIDKLFDSEQNLLNTFQKMQQVYEDWKKDAKIKLNELALIGGLYGKSLPGRSVMLINALELSSSDMPVVFEKNSSPKNGHFVPGTSIQIHGDSEIANCEINNLVIWGWHISDEIVSYLRRIGYTGELWKPLPRFERITDR